MSERRSPIGILDSGFGGLSVALAVRAAMPAEDLVFAADCAFAPWGDRGADFIDQRVHAIVDFLRSVRIKALVLACNTATAVSIDKLRTELSIPVVGIEPAVFPGVRETETGVVGTLATVRTIASERYRHLSANALAWAKENRPMPVSILDCPCPGLMECVERGEFKSAHTLTLLEHYIAPLLAKGTDRLVLGCTHYPFLHEAIEAIIRKLAPEKRVELIDPAPAVAKQLARTLATRKLCAPSETAGNVRFYATGANAAREAVLNALWQQNAQLEALQ